MSNIAIQVEDLSKAYQLGKIGTGTISRDLERFFVTKVLGKEDPFLKIGQTNDRSIKGTSDIVWSLKDIDFTINQGDAVGIIGKNGAGKSTLLKILSRVTSPTTGNVKIKGRVASLLEVGTGFHPELSGRENIYLNGAILGMRKAEIKNKFDEIVDFAGVERYIDTPVKRYSSGMYVRLAFAVAAHLDSEILIVDEVLAVGDAEFQKKCLGKMGDISKGEGRTILFVSHNMAAVQNLCTKGIVLEKGTKQFEGGVGESINHYLNQFSKDSREVSFSLENSPGNDFARFLYASVRKKDAGINDIIRAGDSIEMEFEFYVLKEGSFNLGITFHLSDELGTLVFSGSSSEEKRVISKGYYKEKVTIPAHIMNQGFYSVRALYLVENFRTVVCKREKVLQFEILPDLVENLGLDGGQKHGVIKPKLNWELVS